MFKYAEMTFISLCYKLGLQKAVSDSALAQKKLLNNSGIKLTN